MAAARWEHFTIDDIELSMGKPAMVKHMLIQERQKKNKQAFISLTRTKHARKGDAEQGLLRDFTMEQAVGGQVDWEEVAELAVRPGTKHDVKRVPAAAGKSYQHRSGLPNMAGKLKWSARCADALKT